MTGARTLLARQAANLYWLARYVERADSTARLIEMGNRMAMLPGSFSRQEWRSVAAASGCLDAFEDKEGITEADIIRTLLLDPDNPSSIRACLERARANARSVRTALTSVAQGQSDKAGDERHMEFVADYRITCQNAEQLDRVKFAYFDRFPNAGMLRLQVVCGDVAQVKEVSRTDPIAGLACTQ